MARSVGRVDVDDMLDELTPEEFDEWVAINNIDPLDSGWEQAGVIASTIYNVVLTALYANHGKKVPKQDIKNLYDFMPIEKPKKIRKGSNLFVLTKELKRNADAWQRQET